ncbi:LPS export ABC transporter periplasmic protein LptC [Roseovarius salis]|uniref:LPS export ABC transporter periplasmic protein LptC n=1 Tax=Roseovarius salis TaxID=3376063 RepID=UPI0037C7A588
MSWRENLYSRFVAWMKIILPLAALGILSTVFLISDKFDPAETVPAAGIDLESRARDQGATNAVFAGVTARGHEVTLRTARSVPSADDPRQFEAEDMTARLKLESGRELEIAARSGEIDQSRDRAVLTGNVTFRTSDGYSVTTDRLLLGFDELYAESPGPVSGTAPAGKLTAQRMVLTSDPDTGNLHLLFTAGVKLIYRPERSGE